MKDCSGGGDAAINLNSPLVFGPRENCSIPRVVQRRAQVSSVFLVVEPSKIIFLI